MASRHHLDVRQTRILGEGRQENSGGSLGIDPRAWELELQAFDLHNVHDA
jgi:hypothetical protein